jgi:exopolyphosphatase/guanosine-5'-triphosphate,3'-diphosphate pyrophosphatase
MDIGGGSCEFILCNKHEAFDRFSFEIGVSRLIDKFNPDDPITESQNTEMYRYLDETLSEMFEKTLPRKPKFLVGSSGTFDTFTDILKAEKQLPPNHSASFSYSISDFNRLYHKILGSNMEQRLAIPGMAAFRAEMITASVIAVKCVIDRYEFSEITSSAYSMKEGILFSLSEGKI